MTQTPARSRPNVQVLETAEGVRATGQCGKSVEQVEIPWLDDRGALTISMLLAVLAIVWSGFGIWGVLRHWRHLVETQIRLDRCVGEAALELKSKLAGIEAANRTIQALRGAATTAALAGTSTAAAAFRPAIELAAAKQDLDIGLWKVKQGLWQLPGECRRRGDESVPLPSMSWSRPPADVLGPQPMVWVPGTPQKFEIRLAHSPRAAAAAIEKRERNTFENFWKAAWINPWITPSIHPGRIGAIPR